MSLMPKNLSGNNSELYNSFVAIGANPDQLDQFELLYNAFNFHVPEPGVVLYLGYNPDTVIEYSKKVLFIGLAWIEEVVKKSPHIYINAILYYLNKIGLNKVILDVEQLDLLFKKKDNYTESVSIHRIILLFDFYLKKINLNYEYTCNFPIIDFNKKNSIYLRPGIVELRALQAVKKTSQEYLKIMCSKILKNINCHEYMYQPNTSNDADLLDIEFYIRQLITNAGVYGKTPDLLLTSINDFCARYHNALTESNQIYINSNCLTHSHLARLLSPEKTSPKYYRFGSIQNFYNMIDGKRILFVSPFASLCQKNIESSNIYKIWKNIKVAPFSLTGVDAYVTTYPHSLHESWSQTFSLLTSHVEKYLLSEEYDLVLASCGSYGLPLLHHIFLNHNVNCIYYGNFMNMLFGIKMNDFKDYFDDANLDYWLDAKIYHQNIENAHFARGHLD